MARAELQTRTPLASRGPDQPTTVVDVAGVRFGDRRLVLIGGPCAVEERGQMIRSAEQAAAGGAAMLRGGAWKPRTSPYDFQGLGAEGLDLLAEARAVAGLPFVTEVLDPRDVATVAAVADMLQIGSRSVQNFPLLREAGASGKPVLLKRGMMTTVAEWLAAAEHVLAAGCRDLVFCERGIRSFEPALRNTLDVGSVAVMKALTHLPVIVDPSHASGDARFVTALARAAVAVGADGLLVETHAAPAEALSDAGQALDAAQFAALADECRAVARAVGRDL
jgi:3-deoxy-7-phosphoheptulonate synthase